MKNHHVERNGRARALVLGLAGLVVVAVALLWGWNTFAVEVLGQQSMKFKHALALELLILCVAGVFPLAWRLRGHRISSSE
jgi:hypothetical protein